jgi:hypothetical protein
MILCEIFGNFGHIISFPLDMNRPQAYKKHMKHASDLFWLPRDSCDRGVHWRFDEAYSVMKREQCTSDEIDDCLHSRSTTYDDGSLPIPIFRSEPTSDIANTGFGESRERSSSSRVFIPFPDGFWSDVYSRESRAPMINAVSAW